MLWPLLWYRPESRIRGHIGCPLGKGLVPCCVNIRIMIAGDNRNVGGRTEGFKPLSGLLEFSRQADVGEITRNDDVVQVELVQVAEEGR